MGGHRQAQACVDAYAPGPPYCTCGVRAPASCGLYVPEAQGSLPPGALTRHAVPSPSATARSKRAPWQCPSSAPAAMPPQGAPGGSGQLGTPSVRSDLLGPLATDAQLLELTASKVAHCTAPDYPGASPSAPSLQSSSSRASPRTTRRTSLQDSRRAGVGSGVLEQVEWRSAALPPAVACSESCAGVSHREA